MGIKGAILGDIAGSRFEFASKEQHPSTDLEYNLFGTEKNKRNILLSIPPYFTDDTVLSIATMDAIRHGRKFAKYYQKYGRRYPSAGYGSAFRRWIFRKNPEPYNSYGNGSAMRVSYVGEYLRKCPFRKIVERLAKNSAAVTHNNSEGIKGAVTTAVCIWMAERGKTREEILEYAMKQYPSSSKQLYPMKHTYHLD